MSCQNLVFRGEWAQLHHICQDISLDRSLTLPKSVIFLLYFIVYLLRFERRATERRLASSVETKFRTVWLLVKIIEVMGKMSDFVSDFHYFVSKTERLRLGKMSGVDVSNKRFKFMTYCLIWRQKCLNEWMNESAVILKCVRKPTKSRLSLAHHANTSSLWAE